MLGVTILCLSWSVSQASDVEAILQADPILHRIRRGYESGASLQRCDWPPDISGMDSLTDDGWHTVPWHAERPVIKKAMRALQNSADMDITLEDESANRGRCVRDLTVP